MSPAKTALIIIDVQVGFLEGEWRVHDAPEVLKRLQTLIKNARGNNLPVIFVRHDEDPENDGPLHPALGVQADDVVISKLTPDSFYNTALQETLQAQNIEQLIVAGFQTEYCVDTTTRRARSLDYKVILVKDAHSTFNFPDSSLNAEQIIAHHSDVLQGFAKVIPLAEIDFSAL